MPAHNLDLPVADPGGPNFPPPPPPFFRPIYFFIFFCGRFFFLLVTPEVGLVGGSLRMRMVPLYNNVNDGGKFQGGKNDVSESPPPPPPPSDFFRPGAASQNFRPSLFRNPGSATVYMYPRADLKLICGGMGFKFRVRLEIRWLG